MKYIFDDRIELRENIRIGKTDAQRQQKTAKEILERMNEVPGLILADEVGMGKTFVALAVAVSVALNDEQKRPVVVMVPPSLKEKWPKDFGVFTQYLSPEIASRVTCGSAHRSVEFLKLLDDDIAVRKSIIFLTHGAMYRGLQDGWVKFALIQAALQNNPDRMLEKSICKFVGDLLQMKWVENKVEKKNNGIWEELLNTDPDKWLPLLQKHGVDPENDKNPDTDDDPVPKLVIEVLKKLDTSALYKEMHKNIPKRKSKKIKSNIQKCRKALKDEMQNLWAEAIKQLDYTLPLLILDEAHHLKNPSTRFASLFQDEESYKEADHFSKGALAGVFERMLFLTATPFQLGHHELCSVLDRFDGISWKKGNPPNMGRADFKRAINDLKCDLDRAQAGAVRFERAWSSLDKKNMQLSDASNLSVEAWWNQLKHQELEDPKLKQVVNSFKDAKMAMKTAEKELQRWVIRHIKEKTIKTEDQPIARRLIMPGNGIKDENTTGEVKGIPVASETLLPFLLSSRITTCEPDKRPVFAEGLVSSYEAFLHTRLRNVQKKQKIQYLDEDDELADEVEVNGKGEWYLKHLESIIPRDDSKASLSHPKIDAVVRKVIDLWEQREKVLVFCHFIETGRVLRRHISNSILEKIQNTAAEKFSIRHSDVNGFIDKISSRLDKETPARRAVDRLIISMIGKYELLAENQQQIMEVSRRFFRTPSFLVRYFPSNSTTIDSEIVQEIVSAADSSGMTFGKTLENFFSFLSSRCDAAERSMYLNALSSLQTGAIKGRDALSSFDDSEMQNVPEGERNLLMPNVRLINGATRNETRQKLMLAFNTPFFPEILIASSVMAEGVDLHLNCTHVIHHDLCWNPSTLEQRNGRVDRIGGKNEMSKTSIKVYLPYIAETQDEKMYRVVMDRERWFKIVMGEKIKLDAKSTDKIADRLPLPQSLVEELMFDLGVYKTKA